MELLGLQNIPATPTTQVSDEGDDHDAHHAALMETSSLEKAPRCSARFGELTSSELGMGQGTPKLLPRKHLQSLSNRHSIGGSSYPEKKKKKKKTKWYEYHLVRFWPTSPYYTPFGDSIPVQTPWPQGQKLLLGFLAEALHLDWQKEMKKWICSCMRKKWKSTSGSSYDTITWCLTWFAMLYQPVFAFYIKHSSSHNTAILNYKFSGTSDWPFNRRHRGDPSVVCRETRCFVVLMMLSMLGMVVLEDGPTLRAMPWQGWQWNWLAEVNIKLRKITYSCWICFTLVICIVFFFRARTTGFTSFKSESYHMRRLWITTRLLAQGLWRDDPRTRGTNRPLILLWALYQWPPPVSRPHLQSHCG